MSAPYPEVFKHAVYYLTQLGLSVIPVASCGKNPLVRWTPFQSRRPTLEEIREWFCRKFPGANIAVVTGRVSGVVVLDVDSDTVPEFLSGVRTWVVRTSRGRHFYFRVPPGVDVCCKRLEGIDLKGEGGIVILPRSVHPSGVRYEWEVPPVDKSTGEIIEPPFITDIPELLDLLATPVKNSTSIRDLYKGSPEGQRNVNTARIVGSLALDGLPEHEALALALAVNERNQGPLDEKEVQQVVKSIYKRERMARKQARDLRQQLVLAMKKAGFLNFLHSSLDKYMNNGTKWLLKRISLYDLLNEQQTLDQNTDHTGSDTLGSVCLRGQPSICQPEQVTAASGNGKQTN